MTSSCHAKRSDCLSRVETFCKSSASRIPIGGRQSTLEQKVRSDLFHHRSWKSDAKLTFLEKLTSFIRLESAGRESQSENQNILQVKGQLRLRQSWYHAVWRGHANAAFQAENFSSDWSSRRRTKNAQESLGQQWYKEVRNDYATWVAKFLINTQTVLTIIFLF